MADQASRSDPGTGSRRCYRTVQVPIGPYGTVGVKLEVPAVSLPVRRTVPRVCSPYFFHAARPRPGRGGGIKKAE
eukprot:508516-Hanusia_phi.AAC.1